MGDQPLIGVDDIDTPMWAKGYESTATAGLWAVAREAPHTVATAVRWSWTTSPRLTLLTAVLQLVTGAVTAFGLLATANVLTRLLEQGPTPQRLVAALPAIAAVVGGVLEPLVERRGAGASSSPAG